MITCKMKLDEPGLQALCRLQYQQLRKSSHQRLQMLLKILLCLLCFLLALRYSLKNSITAPIFSAIFIVLGVIYLFLIIFNKRLLLYKIKKRILKVNASNADLERTYCFLEDHIEITTALSTSSFSWKLLECYYRIDHYLFLQKSDQTILLVDEDRLSHTDREELHRYLDANHIFQKNI